MPEAAKKTKLNRIEISAIASKILGDINSKNNDYNESLKNKYAQWLKDFKKSDEYKVAISLINQTEKFNEKYKKLDNNYYCTFRNTPDIEEFCKSVYNTSIKKNLKSSTVTHSMIENDLIIAQAMNKDIESLIVELTEKYSKN